MRSGTDSDAASSCRAQPAERRSAAAETARKTVRGRWNGRMVVKTPGMMARECDTGGSVSVAPPGGKLDFHPRWNGLPRTGGRETGGKPLFRWRTDGVSAMIPPNESPRPPCGTAARLRAGICRGDSAQIVIPKRTRHDGIQKNLRFSKGNALRHACRCVFIR